MGTEPELLKWFAGLGVGGILAGMLFWFYRRDVRGYTEMWKETAGLLIAALEKSTAAHVDNSATNREMIGLLRAVHRRLDADATIARQQRGEA